MDVKTALPVFGKPPEQYDRRFFDDLSRSLNTMTVYLKTPGEGRQTTLVLTNLPDNDYGLEAGSVFQIDGVLRVSLINQARTLSVFSELRVGDVSVAIG